MFRRRKIVCIALILSVLCGSAAFAGNNKTGVQLYLLPDQDNRVFETESWDGLLKWANNNDEVQIYYKDFYNSWVNTSKSVFPMFNSAESKNMFVSAGSSFIHFIFEKPYLHVYLKPADEADLYDYLKKNYGIETYGEILPIVYDEPHIPSDYDYLERIYKKEDLQIGDKKRNCVVDVRVNGKGQRSYTIFFIENGFEIRVAYGDNDEVASDLSQLEQLSFEYKEARVFDEKYKEIVSPSPTPTATPVINPSETPGLNPPGEDGSKWFRLETKKISVRVAKTKTIKIAYYVSGTCFYYSKKLISRNIKKGHFKFKSNKPKIAKVTKKGVVKGIKKGNAIIKVTLLGADEPQYCKVKVLPKKKHKN